MVLLASHAPHLPYVPVDMITPSQRDRTSPELTNYCVQWDATSQSVTERQEGKIEPRVASFGARLNSSLPTRRLSKFPGHMLTYRPVLFAVGSSGDEAMRGSVVGVAEPLVDDP